jgi:hypothetical protein
MSNTITLADLKIQVKAVETLARELGLITDAEERLILSEGSKTYGRAFRLHVTNVQHHDGTRSSAHHTFHPAGSGGYLGMTKADAHRTLYTMAQALSAVTYAQKANAR